MFAAAVVLSGLLAVFFAATGVPKIAGAKLMREVADHFGLADALVRGIGAAELAGAAGLVTGLVVAPLGIAAATGLVLLMAGAVAFHIRAKDPAGRIAGPAIAGLAAIATLALRAATA
jgi:DoxX-like protein